jgi:hypothetical protein
MARAPFFIRCVGGWLAICGLTIALAAIYQIDKLISIEKTLLQYGYLRCRV